MNEVIEATMDITLPPDEFNKLASEGEAAPAQAPVEDGQTHSGDEPAAA